MSVLENVTVLIPIHRTKGNRQWLEETKATFPEETPILVLENRGDVAGAFNRGLREAQTEFVMPFGSDDLAGPMMLDFLLGPAWNADVVYPTLRMVNETLDAELGVATAQPFCGLRLLDNNYIPGAALVRRSKALEVGGYRKMKTLEDWDLWVRMYRAGAKFKPCVEAEMLYRIHPDSRNAQVSGTFELGDYRERIVRGRPGILGRFHKPLPDPLDQAQATFYNAETPATTYLRCQLPARYLPAVVRPDVLYAERDDEYKFPEQRGGAAVFQLAADKHRALTALLMQHKGIRVLVETDDNYPVLPGGAIRRRAGWGQKIGDNPHTIEGHMAIVRKADGVIVTTEALAKSYRKYNPNVYICPNTVDPADWPEPDKPNDGIVRICWIASLSHKDDIALVTPAFQWAAAQPDVEVYTAGIDPGWSFTRGHLPWMNDLDQYRGAFGYFDIGVAPINARGLDRSDQFALGRSDVKALEYAMGGVAPVLSDVAPYDEWEHGETCMKATDADGFKRSLQYLVSRPDRVKEIAAAAREHALAERTTAKQLHTWQEALNG